MKELSTEEKKLLLKDLCGRLPYGVICKCYHTEYNEWDGKPFIATYDSSVDSIDSNGIVFAGGFCYEIDEVRPYLRSKSEISNLISAKEFTQLSGIDLIDWFNANHIDYRADDEAKTMIENGLALEAPKDMYS